MSVTSITSGQILQSTTIISQTVIVENGGSVSASTIANNGIVHINSGGFTTNTSVASGGTLIINAYGSSVYTTINSGAILNVNSGGSALTNMVSGTVNVNSGGFIDSTDINTNGVLNIYSGASIGNIGLFNGSITLNSGVDWGETNFDKVSYYYGGNITVNSGASIHDIADSATFNIQSGAVAQNIVINNANIRVFSGAEVSDITWGNSLIGTLALLNGATVGQSDLEDMNFGGRAVLSIANGTILDNATISVGSVAIASGGQALNTTINGGTLVLNNDLNLISLTNTSFGNAGGNLLLSNGVYDGNALSSLNILQSNVNINVRSATLENITITSQSIQGNAGDFNNITLNNNGSLTLVQGSTSNVTINSAGVLNVSSMTAFSATILYGNLTVNNGGLLNASSAVNSAITTIESGGSAVMYGGEIYNSVTVNSGGNLTLALVTTSSNKPVIISSGATLYASGSLISYLSTNGAKVSASGGTTLQSANITDTQLTLTGSSDISDSVINGGVTNISNSYWIRENTFASGAIVNISNSYWISGNTVNSGATLYITGSSTPNGVQAYDNIINTGGTIRINDSFIYSTKVNSGGLLDISNGSMYGTTVRSGAVAKLLNGSGSNTTINSGGIVYVTSSLLDNTTINKGGTLNLNAGSASSVTIFSNGILNIASNAQVDMVNISKGGLISVGNQGIVSNITVKSAGSAIIGDGGSLAGTITLQNGGYAYITTSTGGIIDLLNGTSLPAIATERDLTTDNTKAGLVISGTGNATTIINGFSGTNPDDSDTITLENVNKNDVSQVTYPDADHVTFTLNNGSTITLNVVGIGNYGYELSSDPNGNLTFEICFLAGTMVETADGFRAIETINIGHLVMTYDPKTQRKIARPVTWIARQNKIVNTNLTKDEAGYPVRILKNALANNIPDKDLLITSEHCLFLNGKLVPVRMLVNGYSIFYDTTITNYEYFHIETDEHSILIADGTLAESYLDTGNRHLFADPNMATNIIHTKKRWNYAAAAPLSVARDFVEPIYQEIVNRIEHETLKDNSDHFNITKDDGLYLITNKGIAITNKTITDDKKVSFTLPPETTGVWIVSRASRPCDVIGSFIDDRRYLGVLIGDIQLVYRKQSYTIDTHLSEASLSGWDVQEAVPCRWTNGKAFLPLNTKQHGKAKQTLTLQILSDHSYILHQEQLIKKNA